MKIISLQIKEFGCFSDRTFELSEGINLIEGENESGKSTLISFIKYIFYGMPRKSAENASFRDRSISWKNGMAAGSITLEWGGRLYRVTRHGSVSGRSKNGNFSDECTIVDLEMRLEVHKGECPGELFFGVPLSVFESTCFVRQLGSGDINAGDLGSSLENMLVSADESIDLSKALDKLDGARKILRHKKGRGGSIPELEDAEASLKTRLARAMEDYDKILSKTQAITEIKETLKVKRAELDRLEDTASALGTVNVIKQFDLLHKTEGVLSAAKEGLDKYKESCGAIPSEGHVSALSESDSAQKTAQRLFDEANENYERTLSAKDDFEREYLSDFNEKVRTETDPKGVCDEIKYNIYASRKNKRTSSILIGTALGILVILLAALLIIAPNIAFTAPIICIPGTVLGLYIRSASKKFSAKTDSMLKDYGVPESLGTAEERLDALRSAFRRYSEAISRLAEHERSVALSESARDMRLADLTTCIAATDELMSEWSGGCDSPIAAIERAREMIREISERENEIRRLSFSAAALSAELKEYNEKDLRARIPSHVVEGITASDIERAEREKKFASMALSQLYDKSISLERELIGLENETENPGRLATELEEVKSRLERESFTFNAIVLAQESLTAASGNIRSTVTPVIKDRASELMAILTADKYSSIGINESYNMFTDSEGAIRSISLLSAGTQDLAYISLRMALLSVFYTDELPPLALDDALTQLDDRRAKNALRLLLAYAEKKGQSILFTCHSRERRFLGEMGGANIITL